MNVVRRRPERGKGQRRVKGSGWELGKEEVGRPCWNAKSEGRAVRISVWGNRWLLPSKPRQLDSRCARCEWKARPQCSVVRSHPLPQTVSAPEVVVTFVARSRGRQPRRDKHLGSKLCCAATKRSLGVTSPSRVCTPKEVAVRLHKASCAR
jgi:hypothetical protein